jgi:antitoxin (DNA-binding transcriptional repressor) of toxin-antitoxin stability system
MRPHRGPAGGRVEVEMARASRSIGIRELKAHLSAAVRDAAGGAHIVVTDRGRAVAELGPPQGGGGAPEDLDARLTALGGTPARAAFIGGPPPAVAAERVDVAALLDELRGER